MGRGRKCRTEDELGEDFCFICKDGGLLRFCDFKGCPKAYHPECIGREDSLESEDHWTCDWHSCILCSKTSKFRCFGCPQAVCGHCVLYAEFARVRGSKGFCSHCLKLALLIEDCKDVDFDGTKVDFNDRDTYEFLFKEYWEIMKKKEALTAKHVHTASNLLKKGSNHRRDFDLNEIGESEEDTDEYEISDYEELVATEEGHKLVRKGKRSKEKLGPMRKKMKLNNKEFVGWGSKSVIDFLSTIGKDTSKKFSQHDVASIIRAYCKENKLFHPQKKKKILCDAQLHAIFGRKSVTVNTVHKHLTAHFAENLEQSSEDESSSSTEEKNDNSSMACLRPRKLVTDKKLAVQKPSAVSHNCFAAIVVANIKLVYLKRSLVERLLENQECFEGKMIGSFIRAKCDPNDYSQKNSYQLLRVTGIKIDSSNINEKPKFLLQVTNRLDYIPIDKLSDDDFSEEECKDLCQRVSNGLVKNPTVVELYEKVKSLHEDITKHWIPKELARLQTCIDHANEKGWRRELFDYMEKRILLQKPSEQARLLTELPEVIADIPEPTFDDLLKEEEQVNHMLVDWIDDGKDTIAAGVGKFAVPIIPEEKQHFDVSTGNNFAIESCIPAAELQAHKEQHQSILPKEHTCSKTLFFGSHIQTELINIQESRVEAKVASEVRLIQESMLKSKPVSEVQLIHESMLKRKPASEVQLIQESMLKSKAASEVQLIQESIFKGKPASEVQLFQESMLNSKAASEVQLIQESMLTSKPASEVQLIELSDDDDDDLRVEVKKQDFSENPNSSMWYCESPEGETRGPLPILLLKQWNDSRQFELKCKVWKNGQSSQEAILLSDAIRLLFPE